MKIPADRLVDLIVINRIETDVLDDHFEIATQDDLRKESIAAAARARPDEMLTAIKDRMRNPSPYTFEEPDTTDFGHTIQSLIASHVAEKRGVKHRGAGQDTAALRALTDLGNAERFAGRYVGQIRYVIERGMWAIWDGTRWLLDEEGLIEQMMKETARSIWNEVLRAPSAGERMEIAKHAMRSESHPRLQAALRLGQTEPGIPTHIHDFDADAFAINCVNGLLDLRPDGILAAHNPTMLVMKRVNVSYDPKAQCPTWHRFLERVLPNPAVRAFVKRFVGYVLTGSTREQGFLICYGTGSNGKTTLFETIGALLSDYAQSTTMDTFTAKRTEGGIPNDVARMAGARFISAVETNENVRLNESLIKQLTGGDTITARFLHHEFFDFRPTHKLAISVNHKPIIKGTDHAIWRRIWLTPFTETIPDDEQDKDLKEKLLAELPGILAWAVEGCREWQEKGLNPPAAIAKATKEYRDEMDVIGSWMAECCLESPTVHARAKDLYVSYVTWAEQSGERARSQKDWGGRLTEKGFTREHRRDGYYWLGIGLLSPNSGPSSVTHVTHCDPLSGISAHEREIEKNPLNTGHNGSHGSHDRSPVTSGTDELLWTWVGAVHAGRVTEMSEDVRQAAQRVGFTFDPFAPIYEEAGRLGAHLDALKSAAR